jgi:hypothetical protein
MVISPFDFACQTMSLAGVFDVNDFRSHHLCSEASSLAKKVQVNQWLLKKLASGKRVNLPS